MVQYAPTNANTHKHVHRRQSVLMVQCYPIEHVTMCTGARTMCMYDGGSLLSILNGSIYGINIGSICTRRFSDNEEKNSTLVLRKIPVFTFACLLDHSLHNCVRDHMIPILKLVNLFLDCRRDRSSHQRYSVSQL